MPATKRNKRRYMERKPLSIASIVWGTVGILSFLSEVLLLLIDAYNDGYLPNYMGGMGVLLMAVSVVALYFALLKLRDDSVRGSSKAFGVAAAAISLVLWILLYCVGILVG